MPYLVIILILIGGILTTRNYKKDEIGKPDKREHPLRILYPTAYWLHCTWVAKFVARNAMAKKERLQAVHATRNVERVTLWYSCKVISFLLLIVLLTSGAAWCGVYLGREEGSLVEGRYLLRPQVGENAKEVELGVRIGGEAGTYGDERIEVPARRYTKEEAREVMSRVREELPEDVLGENLSRNQIEGPLHLAAGKYGIRIDWETDGEYVGYDGSVNNEYVKGEGVGVALRAKLSYGEWEDSFETFLTIVPPNDTEEERLRKELKKEMEATGEEGASKERWELPASIDGHEVVYEEREGGSPFTIIILGALCLMGTPYLMAMELEGKLKKRNREMLLDYPELMNKFMLLLGAGMTVKGAWGRITCEYAQKRKKGLCSYHYVYEEMCITWNEISNGQSEGAAYERFGRRVKLTAYTKFCTLITQNIRKGNARLLELLEGEALDAWEERKEAVKRLGEEASSKLLVPMMLMFGVVLAILLFPAIATL